MPSENVQLVLELFGGKLVPGAEVDLLELFADDELREKREDLIHPDAPIKFATPDGGLLGAMGGPFFGAKGLNEGWGEWLGPWESYSLRADGVEEGDGKVLLLAHCAGRMSGSGVELDAPVAGVYYLEGGKIVRVSHFLDQEQARAEAGLPG
jgi:hypothetical protein